MVSIHRDITKIPAGVTVLRRSPSFSRPPPPPPIGEWQFPDIISRKFRDKDDGDDDGDNDDGGGGDYGYAGCAGYPEDAEQHVAGAVTRSEGQQGLWRGVDRKEPAMTGECAPLPPPAR